MATMNLSRSSASLDREVGAMRARAVARINAACGAARLRFITEIPGQQMTYLAKEEEARRYKAEIVPPADLSDYPFLAAEMAATGEEDADAAADIIIAEADAWRVVGPQIEQLRRWTTVQIAAATTAAGIDTLVSDCLASLETIG